MQTAILEVTLVGGQVRNQWDCFSLMKIEYFIPDFSNWKDHDSYQTAFQRLVKDLKAGLGVSKTWLTADS